MSPMPSGRRQSVLIFCASAVKELYLAPAEHYDPDRVFAFVSSNGDQLSILERNLFSETKKEIQCRDVRVIDTDTRDYEGLVCELIAIKNDLVSEFGEYLDLYVNISSGTNEFAAAAMFISMMSPRATAFRVDVADTGLTDPELNDTVAKINSLCRISEPSAVTAMQNKDPDDEMLAFLGAVRDILAHTKYPKYADIIGLLKDDGFWSYDADRKRGSGRTTPKQREERYLRRHYIDPAMENGWLERPSPKTMRLTESGNAYLSVFGKADGAEYLCASDIGYEADPCMNEAPVRMRMPRMHMAEHSEGRRSAAPGRFVKRSCLSENVSEDSDVISFERNGKKFRFRLSQE